jgi:hypothetical protein
MKFIIPIYEYNSGFVISKDKWDEFYSNLNNMKESDSVDIAKNILYKVKHDNNYFITKNQYDTIINIINGEKIQIDKKQNKKNKEHLIKIPYSTLDNFYMELHPPKYFVNLIKSLKKKKPDNEGKIEITTRQYNILQRLKNGNYRQEDYFSKN